MKGCGLQLHCHVQPLVPITHTPEMEIAVHEIFITSHF